MKKLILIILSVLLLASFATALSQTDVTNIVSKQNNYLLDRESAVVYKPAVTIAYQGTDYWVVAGIQDETVTVYIPINNDTGELANGEIEKRKLIETEIVLSRIYQLKNSVYGTVWPFTHSMNSSFYDYQRVFGDMIPKVISVQTELEAISGSNSLVLKADNIKSGFEDLALNAEIIAKHIEEARLFEEKYFSKPDTNQTGKYENYFEDYFDLSEQYKTDYYAIEGAIQELKAELASFEGATSEQKEFFFVSLGLPRETEGLKTFFGQSDQLKTLVESVFNEGQNIEAFVGNLTTRKSRNESWQVIYGTSTKLTKVGQKYNITTLAGAASLILAAENIDYWAETEAVEAMRTNWVQAESRYEKGDYDKAKNFGEKAEEYATTVLEGKFIATENEFPQELIIQIVIVLIVVLIAIFVFQKVIKKKKNPDEGYEEYGEYEDYSDQKL